MLQCLAAKQHCDFFLVGKMLVLLLGIFRRTPHPAATRGRHRKINAK
jgi:hypothetical protein